jgi:hypothetical protein
VKDVEPLVSIRSWVETDVDVEADVEQLWNVRRRL